MTILTLPHLASPKMTSTLTGHCHDDGDRIAAGAAGSVRRNSRATAAARFARGLSEWLGPWRFGEAQFRVDRSPVR